MVNNGEAVPPPRRVQVPNALIRALRFAPSDARRLALATGPLDRNVARELRWYTETAGLQAAVPAPAWLLDVEALPDGMHTLVANERRAFLLAPDGTVQQEWPFGPGTPRELALAAAGNRLAGVFLEQPGTVQVLDLNTGETFSFDPPPGREFSRLAPNVALSDDGLHVAASFGFAATCVWSIQGGAMWTADPGETAVGAHPSVAEPDQFRSFLPTTGAVSRRLWLDPSGERFTVAGMIPYRTMAPFMSLWRASRDSPAESCFIAIDSTFAGVDLVRDPGLCVASDGQERDRIALWDLASGQLLCRAAAGVADVTDLRVSRDVTRIAVAGGSELAVHELAVERWQPPGQPANSLWRIQLNAQATIVAAGSASFRNAFAALATRAEPSWPEWLRVAAGMEGS